jgi:hypothetical protein
MVHEYRWIQEQLNWLCIRVQDGHLSVASPTQLHQHYPTTTMPRKLSIRMARINSRMEEAIVAVHNNQFEHVKDAATYFKVNYNTLL